MVETLIFTVVTVVVVLILFLMAGKKYSSFIEENKADFQFLFMAPASLSLMDKLRLHERMQSRMMQLQQKISILYPSQPVIPYTRMYIAQIISFIFVCFLGGGILGLLGGGDVRLVVLGIIVACLIPFLMVKKLDEKTDKRKKDIIFELPEFASKVALLVNAGETVQNAIIRCSEMKEEDDNPLYLELNDAVTKLKNGESFNHVMEELSKRCGVQELAILTTTILLNYRRGGSELSLALREISGDLWEKRKVISRTRGEEASSKLIFPMVLIFVAVLLVIAYPALMIFG
ncbi:MULTISPECIES: type II secretion system F family protein [Bacillaceae]|uniref:Type II secretion system F family protein n=1 Tax=Evansella alkalicola TaxID=745819 RepID=A0ABS6K075_9BACI|nr:MULTISPECIES: type II secretion system F family protein [Bacillaceae]MBU9724250.1 type II secretion system F family protein [Bacillus alkalicola]